MIGPKRLNTRILYLLLVRHIEVATLPLMGFSLILYRLAACFTCDDVVTFPKS